MGFQIVGSYTTPHGLSLAGLHVTLRANYRQSKNSIGDYVVKGTFNFYYDLDKAVLHQERRTYTIASADYSANPNIPQHMYTAFKTEFGTVIDE